MTVKYDRINDKQTCNDLNPMISKQRLVSLSQPVIMYVCYKVYKAESKRDELENSNMFFPVNNKTLVGNVCESEIQTLGRLNLIL